MKEHLLLREFDTKTDCWFEVISSNKEPYDGKILIKKGPNKEIHKEIKIRLMYGALFGIDISDIAMIRDKVTQFIETEMQKVKK